MDNASSTSENESAIVVALLEDIFSALKDIFLGFVANKNNNQTSPKSLLEL